MAMTKVACPSCGIVLVVPPASVGRKGRCTSCGDVFVITPMSELAGGDSSASDEDIMDWLGPAGIAAASPAAARPSAAPAAKVEKAPPQADREHKRFPVRLGHVDDMGAFFVFDPQLLYDEDFRCSFPRKCIVCGSKSHLSVHLIIWSSKLPERGQLGVRNGYLPSVYDLKKLGGLRGRRLLAALGRVPNLPEPYCLPFPYYVCQACSAVGVIVNDVRFAPGTNSRLCELGICSLARAEEFFVTVRGPGSQGQQQIRKALAKTGGDPWRAIPLAVRSRIKHWYEKLDDERFVSFIPDGDFAKSEAGQAGVVVTDRRMVYRKFARRIEVPFSDQITIAARGTGERIQLKITAPGNKTAIFTSGTAGAQRLRKCLLEQGVRARWVT